MARQHWQSKAFERERLLLKAELDQQMGRGPGPAMEYLSGRIESLADAEAATLQMRRFIYILDLLALGRQDPTFPDARRQGLVDLGREILKAYRVSSDGSRFAALHRELDNASVAPKPATGPASFREAWAHATARKVETVPGLDDGDKAAALRLAQADQTFRLGHTERALIQLEALDDEQDGTRQLDGLLAQARARRLAGDQLDASLTRQRLKFLLDSGTPEQKRASKWEDLAATASEGNLKPMFEWLRSLPPEDAAAYQLEAFLWAHAVPTLEWQSRATRPTNLRRRFPDRFRRDQPQHALYEFSQRLEQAYGEELELEQKLNLLGESLATLGRMQNLQHELLAQLAAARWLVRRRQWEAAELVGGEYKSLSQKISSGATTDSLGIGYDLDLKLVARSVGSENETMERLGRGHPQLAQGRLDAAVEVTRATVKIASLVARGALQKLVADPDGKRQIEVKNRKDVATVLASYAGKRRGMLFKAGQVIRFVDGVFDLDIAQEFDVFLTNVPRVPDQEVRRMFKEDFGSEPEALFAEWNPAPFAAGSIGQVHRARLKDGHAVAVKVRYPQIDRVIHADMRQAKLLKPFFQSMFRQLDYDGIVNEIYEQVLLETDFARERTNTDAFRTMFAGDPDIVIPETFAAHSSRRILTSTFIAGEPFQDFCITASQAARNHIGQVLTRFSHESSSLHMRNYFDLQPGNLIVSGNRLALIDFGGITEVSRSLHHSIKGIMAAYFGNDPEVFVDRLVDAGYFPNVPRSAISTEGVLAVYEPVYRPYAQDRTFQFTDEYLKEQLASHTALNPLRDMMTVPTEAAWGLRIHWSLYQLLTMLKAEANWHRLILPYYALGRSAA